MAIRKVSDLERLYLREQLSAGHEDQISNMLLEVSWPDSIGSKSFVSKHMTYQDVVENILVDNLLCSGTFVDFYAPITFHNSISVHNGAWISGDFFVNLGVEDDILLAYQTLIRNGKNTIQSIGEDGTDGTGTTFLCSQFSNILSAGYENIICAAQQNIFQAQKNIICSDTQVLASFDDDWIVLRSDEGNLNLDFKDLSVHSEFYLSGPAHFYGRTEFTGDTYFTKVINGCALCAKWADLAEHYSSDGDYPPGTLVQFGGEDSEITIATTEANAVITTAPGLVLNGMVEGTKQHKAVALAGRTPVRVIGKTKKFDRLVFSETIPGVARSLSVEEARGKKLVGVALESSDVDEEKLILAAVQLAF